MKIYAFAAITGLKTDFSEKYENGTHLKDIWKGIWKGRCLPPAGVVFQVCLWKGLTLNASYEYSHIKGSDDYGIKNLSTNTFVVGTGRMFYFWRFDMFSDKPI